MSQEEWQANIEISELMINNILTEQFPHALPIKSIKKLGEGWDNTIFLINQNTIFRFPKRKASVDLMNRENKILNHLPHFSDIQTPKIKYFGEPTLLFPYPYQGYEILKGLSGYQANLSDQDRKHNIKILAKFLKELHNIDEVHAIEFGANSQGAGSRANIKETIRILEERTNKLQNRKILDININNLKEEFYITSHLNLPKENCFVHGDLDSRHLIFNEKKLIGIIDWGDTDITNRAIDLDVVWTFFPSECHEQFFEIYGAVDKETWQYARFLGIYCAFSLILYAKELNDEPLFLESINAIRRINKKLIE